MFQPVLVFLCSAALGSGYIARYRDVFREMDSNGDGQVSKTEFFRAFRKLRVRLPSSCCLFTQHLLTCFS